MNIMTKYAIQWMAMGNPDPRPDLILREKITRLKLYSVTVSIFALASIYMMHSYLPKEFSAVKYIVAVIIAFAVTLIVIIKKIADGYELFEDQASAERFSAVIKLVGKISGKTLTSEELVEFGWSDIHDSIRLAVEKYLRQLAKAYPKDFDNKFDREFRDVTKMLLMSTDPKSYKDSPSLFLN